MSLASRPRAKQDHIFGDVHVRVAISIHIECCILKEHTPWEDSDVLLWTKCKGQCANPQSARVSGG